MPLRLTSEPYSPGGSMPASTLTRAVTNTNLDEWSVLLRETLQNSVDARLSDSRPVHYRVTIGNATDGQRSALRGNVFKQQAHEVDSLPGILEQADLPLLVIADWETRGLGGPTRADIDTTDRTDFCDFFLNVGREERKRYQGGTYGLGRGVLFDISAAGAIVVYTRARVGRSTVSRFLAMAIGPGFVKDRRKYTGRHWWGANANSTWPEPLTDEGADKAAAGVGLDVIPTGKTGTAIMVIAPRIPEGHTHVDVIDQMINAAHLYGWPLMVGHQDGPSVMFDFGIDGDIWVPEAPDSEGSGVRRFVEAYRLAVEQEPPSGPTSWHRVPIAFGAGRASPLPLGTLVFRHFPPVDKQVDVDDDSLPIPSSSIALMRDPRMVVRYLPVSKHPLGSSTVGVFIADSSFDQEFAEAEPVAHDDWLPSKLDAARFSRNPVKQALDKVKQAVKDSWQTTGSRQRSPLGPDSIAPVVGDWLGGMVADTPGFGGSPQGSGGGGGQKPPRPRSTQAAVGAPSLRPDIEGGAIAVFPVEVHRVGDAGMIRLCARPSVVLDGGTEAPDDAPAGAERPVVIGWEDPVDGAMVSTTAALLLQPGSTRSQVLIRQPRDTVVTVSIELHEVSA